MNKRKLIFVSGLIAISLITGCQTKEEKLSGYWLQNSEKRPVSMHIKPDDSDFLVNINQLNFGRFSRDIEKGVYKGNGILTIGEKKQVRYSGDNDSLSDVDDKTITFKRVTADQYKAASSH
ncbi:hypothetical protein EGT81_04890 [Alcaligenes faecalis]|uniref:hypothetical protein n=1 Tax=Alcaligenes faecalis TaxID=511 RepID=UPI000F6690F8|nr:hypothetical protein [Alcaligenes faecalis]RSE63639.1 hypothetical protein EGT81_04890 [Alcaligenes faecalis]